MTLPKYALQYEDCTDKEIEKFVQERGVKGLPNKRSLCIQVLRALDEDTSFRFLNLPPELRNIIYQYILTPSAQNAQARPFDSLTCSPQVLATCKQIHSEASDILFHSSVPLRVHLGPHGSPGRLGDVRNNPYSLQVSFNTDVLFTSRRFDISTPIAWPVCLTKLRSIRLNLQFDWPVIGLSGLSGFCNADFETAGIQMNRAIMQLIDILSRSTCLEELNIWTVRPNMACFMNWDYDILSPISAFGAQTKKVTYEGGSAIRPLTQKIKDAVDGFHVIKSYDETAYNEAMRPKFKPFEHLGDGKGYGILRYANAQELQDIIKTTATRGKTMTEGDCDA